MKIEYKIEGKYTNGDRYFDSHYDIFELSELLEELTNGDFNDVKNSNSPMPETLKITAINQDGDEI